MNSDLPLAIVSPPAEIRGVPQAAGKDNRKNPFNQNQQEQPSLGGFLVNSNPTVSGTNNGTTVGQSQNYTYFIPIDKPVLQDEVHLQLMAKKMAEAVEQSAVGTNVRK